MTFCVRVDDYEASNLVGFIFNCPGLTAPYGPSSHDAFAPDQDGCAIHPFHQQIHPGHVGHCLGDPAHGLRARLGLAQYGEPRLGLQRGAHPLPHDGMVVDEEDSDWKPGEYPPSPAAQVMETQTLRG